MSFANLKNNRANALQGLQNQVQQSLDNQGGSAAKDPRFWKMPYDKTTKVGSAVIRFLPFGNGERLPWAAWTQYNFKHANGSYWNRIRTDLGGDEKDPMKEINSLAWARNLAGDQKGCKDRTIKKRFVANIVVLNDPANPANNGKVFLYEYGPSIQDIIMAAMAPKYDDQAKVPVFDFWAGANFNIRTCEDKKFLSYKDSQFAPAAPLHADDAVMENVYNQMHDLTEFEAADKYKSYDDLKAEVIKVVGARTWAELKGEQFSPEQAAQSGANPFGQEQAQQAAPAGGNPFANQGQQQAASADANPFANQAAAAPLEQQQAAAVDANPFGNQAQEPAAEGNPFANQAELTEGQVAADPAAVADPFANLKL